MGRGNMLEVVKFLNPYWDDSLKLSYLQRRILVNSFIYYGLNDNIVSDAKYEGYVKQYMGLKNKASAADFEASKYAYAFRDFEGSTGFYLYNRLKEEDKEQIAKVAYVVLKCYRKDKGFSK